MEKRGIQNINIYPLDTIFSKTLIVKVYTVKLKTLLNYHKYVTRAIILNNQNVGSVRRSPTQVLIRVTCDQRRPLL